MGYSEFCEANLQVRRESRAARSLDARARGPVGGVPAGSSILACISVQRVGGNPTVTMELMLPVGTA
jgi:hypothetical protein